MNPVRFTLLGLFVLFFVVGCNTHEPHDEPQELHEQVREAKEQEAEGVIEEGPFMGEPHAPIRADFAWDGTNDYDLCGNSDYVFYGEVALFKGSENKLLEPDPETGVISGTPMPQTQFEVIVDRIVKGSLEPESVVRDLLENKSVVVVNQAGGQVNNTMPVEIMEGDEILVPGEGYIFFANYDAEAKRYDIVQPNGNQQYAGDELEDRLTVLSEDVCPVADEEAARLEAEREALVDAASQYEEEFGEPTADEIPEEPIEETTED